jgi:DNA-binding FadR family transcriptional regulator
MINMLWEQVQRFRRITMGAPGRMRETLVEHRKIVDAITDRNVVLAQALAMEHIENAENQMLEAARQQIAAKVEDQQTGVNL